MTPKLAWLSFVLLSGLWAGTLWVGYELLAALPGIMPDVSSWLRDVPMLLALHDWSVQLLSGMGGVLPALAWTVWLIGQIALLLLVWAALKFVPAHSIQRLRAMVGQQWIDRRY